MIVADDDETIRVILQEALRRSGRLAVPVDDGCDIWPILEREAVGAIVLDLNMRGMNGWEVLRRLKNDPELAARRRSLRVIVISGQSDPASRDFALRLGADAFLAKPLDLDRLCAELAPSRREELE